MRKYFERRGIMVRYAMNITDIDDKIVNRVYHKKYQSLIIKMIEIFGKDNVQKNGMTEDIANDPNNIKMIREWLLNQKLIIYGSEQLRINHTYYQDYIDFFDNLFWNDMASIGVNKPDIVTKVSDNINSIIEFIKKIITNGYAYTSNGSVYFDSKKFKESGFDFAPLRDGKNHEDMVSGKNIISEKKDPADFALWKAAKEYDISFPSPWGLGRPGWHIECSSMIHDALGEDIDIHTGGIDLKFPHHNNECVQTWAYYNSMTGHPKNYMHTGHLHINKEKMSQSLGNIITISDFLEKIGSVQQMRLMFFYHKWNDKMEYTDGVMVEIKYLDKRFRDFISHLSFLIRENKMKKQLQHTDIHILEHINNYSLLVDTSLDRDFNTSSVLLNAETTMDYIYSYLEDENYDVSIAHKANAYMKKISSVLELGYYEEKKDIGNTSTHVDIIVKIRDSIRDSAKTIDGSDNRKKLFALTDEIRDVHLKKLGVSIEDRGLGKSTKWF